MNVALTDTVIAAQTPSVTPLPRMVTSVDRHIGRDKWREMSAREAIRHLISLRTCVELENLDDTLPQGDITAFCGATIPTLKGLLGKLLDHRDYAVEDMLYQAGFPYTCIAHQGPRVYLTQVQFIELDSDAH